METRLTEGEGGCVLFLLTHPQDFQQQHRCRSFLWHSLSIDGQDPTRTDQIKDFSLLSSFRPTPLKSTFRSLTLVNWSVIMSADHFFSDVDRQWRADLRAKDEPNEKGQVLFTNTDSHELRKIRSPLLLRFFLHLSFSQWTRERTCLTRILSNTSSSVTPVRSKNSLF